jgi:hypothetical protein
MHHSSTTLTLKVIENKLLAHADPNPEDIDSSNSGMDTATNIAQAMCLSTSPGCYCHYHKLMHITLRTAKCSSLLSSRPKGRK